MARVVFYEVRFKGRSVCLCVEPMSLQDNGSVNTFLL
jgi:hypothetical protein